MASPRSGPEGLAQDTKLVLPQPEFLPEAPRGLKPHHTTKGGGEAQVGMLGEGHPLPREGREATVPSTKKMIPNLKIRLKESSCP